MAMERTPVTRAPIKLRKSIQREYCGCYDASVLVVGGVPQLLLGDKLTTADMIRYLDNAQVSTPVYFSSYQHDKVIECLKRKLPVTIRTNQVLPTFIIDQLSSVPHSAIHVSINFLDDFLRNYSEAESSEVEDLRRMMYVAKSKKIFIALQMGHFPHLSSKLDAFELVDMMKNLVSHILLSFPRVLDTDYRDSMSTWESYNEESLVDFKSFYTPHVPSRSWEVKGKYQEEFISELQDFIKSKKITLELLQYEEAMRIRHTPMGSSLALGIRPFMYVKQDGIFVKSQVDEEPPCNTCGKTMFL